MSFFILGIAVLIAVLLMARWYVSVPPKTLLSGGKWLVFGVALGLVLWLMLSGKLWAAVAALPAILVWLMRMLGGLRIARMLARLIGLGGAAKGWSSPGADGGPSSGQSSYVHTRFVVMHLDHGSGHVSGQVLEGRFAGRALESLSLNELLQLYGEAQIDADSARVVEGYLDRFDANWRDAHQQDRSTAYADPGNMDRQEAFKVLGLQAGAGADDIKAAHRRLMANLHPDKGGSDYLAQQINRAKDVLLKK
ncbi:MAG: DnaJ domain-containing protein [Magnetovibrio sp.]|nr:DnaJ domain-containing protein [Magnetovibrio sp.]